MIDHIIFDLSEVFLRGLKDFEHHFCPDAGIDPPEFRRCLQGPKLYALFEGTISEDEYWGRVREEGRFRTLSNPILKRSLRGYFTEMPGSVDVLRRVHRNGTPMTLLSDHGREWIDHIEQSNQFLCLFGERCYSFQSGHTKDEPSAFEYALSRSSADPARTLFVDDNPSNVANARKAGISYTHHFTSPGNLETYLAGQRLI